MVNLAISRSLVPLSTIVLPPLPSLDSLKTYFEQFGKITHCTIMRDSESGRSRGFAFLTFEDPASVNTVMSKDHYLDGKTARLSFARAPGLAS